MAVKLAQAFGTLRPTKLELFLKFFILLSTESYLQYYAINNYSKSIKTDYFLSFSKLGF